MRVLGLDPGSRHFGWGIVERSGTRLRHVAHGVIHTQAPNNFPARLVSIEEGLLAILKEHAPSHASVESIFFAKDARAASLLGHARGVALLVCARQTLPIAEYPPALIKKTVTGSGRGEKKQVAQMIRIVLGLLAPPPLDASDALAAALTHLHSTPLHP